MVRVKICCIASVEEAALAVRHGAAALGLVGRMPSGPGGRPNASITPRSTSTLGFPSPPMITVPCAAAPLAGIPTSAAVIAAIIPHVNTPARRRGASVRVCRGPFPLLNHDLQESSIFDQTRYLMLGNKTNTFTPSMAALAVQPPTRGTLQ